MIGVFALKTPPALRPLLKMILRLFGYYVVIDYGVTMSSSGTYAAGNTTALEALWVRIANNGRGTMVFPPGFCALNPTTLDTNTSSNPCINIQGAGSATILYFYGTTGPFLNIASNIASGLARGFIRDLHLRHAAGQVPTSGATLQLSYAGLMVISNVRSEFNTSGEAPITAVRLHAGATQIAFENCKFTTREDEAALASAGLTPIGLDIATSGSTSGLVFHNTEFSGCQNRSIGIRWAQTSPIDTVEFSGLCLIKDHETGMRFGFGNDNGGVSNLAATGLKLDGITGQAVHYAPKWTGTGSPPATASRMENHQYVGCWFAGTAEYVFLVENNNDATMIGLQLVGCYLTGATNASIIVLGSLDELLIVGNRISSGVVTAGHSAIEIGNGPGTITDVLISGNRILVGALADACITIASNVDPLVIQGNILRGGADADGVVIAGALSASRVYDAAQGAWKA